MFYRTFHHPTQQYVLVVINWIFLLTHTPFLFPFPNLFRTKIQLCKFSLLVNTPLPPWRLTKHYFFIIEVIGVPQVMKQQQDKFAQT